MVDVGVVDVVVVLVVDVLLPVFAALPLPVVVDVPGLELPARPPAWLPRLFCGPVGE